MGRFRNIVVFDVGKTNLKTALVDRLERRELAVLTQRNTTAADGPYPHLAVEAIWAFFQSSIMELAGAHPIDGISVSAHGASVCVLGADSLALPALDYEYSGPEALADIYQSIRPKFSETYSPRLPGGLVVGAQLHWLEETFPEEFVPARWIVSYPQYWTWRLTGDACNEITSVGCHTDLWNHRAGAWSSLVLVRGWERKMAPIKSALQPQGHLRNDLAKRWGLPNRPVVAGGLHDSNASLIPHLLDHEPPFAVVSTGTWAILFSVGVGLQALDESRDTLANINVFGQSVASARFMGGREYEILTEGSAVEENLNDLRDVLDQRIMVLPSVVQESGPFPGMKHQWSAEPKLLPPGVRNCTATLYLVMMTMTCLDLIKAAGDVMIDGPFAQNKIYCDALSTLTGRPVHRSSGEVAGTILGAALLFDLQGDRIARAATRSRRAEGLPDDLGGLMAEYAEAWQSAVWRRAENEAGPRT